MNKIFVLEILNDMKDYYQMPSRWSDGEKNSFISVGYCPVCDEIKDLTNTRRYFDGSDCMGENWSSRRVPLQCFDSRHEGVLEFDAKTFDYFLKYLEFFKQNKDYLCLFELKKNSLPKGIQSKIKINSNSYDIFRSLIDKWKGEEIDKMYNPAYVNTDEFSKLIEDYKRWDSMSWENQMNDIDSLHKQSFN